MEQRTNTAAELLEELLEEVDALGGKLANVYAVMEQGAAYLSDILERLTEPKASNVRTIGEEEISDLVKAGRLFESAMDLQESHVEVLRELLGAYEKTLEGEND